MSDGQTSLHGKKNVGGRPPEREEVKRATINMRTTPTIRAALEDAAARGGRSLAQEIEQRLERSVAADEGAGSIATAAFLASITADIGAIETATGKGWTVDLRTYGAVRFAITEAVADLMPVTAEYAGRVRNALADVQGLSKATAFAGELMNGRLPASVFPDAVKWKATAGATLDKMQGEVERETSELMAELESEADRGREIFQAIVDQREQIARLRKRS